MKFIKTNNPNEVAQYLANKISDKLSDKKKVLWLVSGGSSIPIAVAASQQIHGVGSNLFITLSDERPGPVDHAQSNWKQLKDSGFNYLRREHYEVLQDQEAEAETALFNGWLDRSISSVDFRIALVGIGADGHTAGILPGKTLKKELGYAGLWEDGDRQRISVTPIGISLMDEVVVMISGNTKRQLIDKLRSKNDVEVFPAEYLKAAGELTIYNNWMNGEE